MKDITILKVDGIGNMISIEDMKSVLNDALCRCNEGSNIYNTYDAVLEMITTLSDEYDKDLE